VCSVPGVPKTPVSRMTRAAFKRGVARQVEGLPWQKKKSARYIFQRPLRARIPFRKDVPAHNGPISAPWRISIVSGAMPVRIALSDLLAKKTAPAIGERSLLPPNSGRFLSSQKGHCRFPRRPAPVESISSRQMDRNYRTFVARRCAAAGLRHCLNAADVLTRSARRECTRFFHRLAGVGGCSIHAPRQGWTVRPFRAARRDLDALCGMCAKALELLRAGFWRRDASRSWEIERIARR